MLKRHLAVILSCCSISAFAANATPFDQEIGVAKCPDVVKSLSSKVSFTADGVNRYTGGEMYIGDAKDLGLSRAKTILLICDKNTVLSGLILTLDTKVFDQYKKILTSKYKQVKLINPFVGNKYAKYVKGNSVILLDEPHMSFNTTVTYATKDLMKNFDTINKQEDQNIVKHQQNSL